MPDRSTGDRPSLTADELQAVEAATRVVLELPHRARLELHRRLERHLAEPAQPPSANTRLLERQRGALAALEQVARAAGCEPGVAPTPNQFRAYAKDLGLPWSVSSVGRAFRSWRNAKRAYEEARVPDSARPVPQREALASRRVGHGEHLGIVAAWLSADPAASTPEEYGVWRQRHNETAAATGRAPAWRQITRAFPELTVEDIIAAARGEVDDPAELAVRRAEERLASEPNPLRLAGTRTFAALARTSMNAIQDARRRSPDGFPVAVVSIGKEAGFYVQDIYEYRDRGRAPSRRPGELDGIAIGNHDVSALIGRSVKSVILARARQAWHLCPPPDGRYSNIDYWLRDHVVAWVDERSR